MKNGWQTKTLDQISENLDSRRIPITKAVRASGEYPYYGASGIVDYVAEYIFDEDTLLISEDGANLLARSTPIAFPASGKYWVNNHAHILKFENMTTQRFVELYLDSIPLDDYVTGAAQPKLNQKALNSIPIPVPPLPEQQRIVGILDEAFEGIATAKANAEKNLQNARALFESHLNAVFTQRGDGWEETTLGGATGGIFTGPFGSLLHKSDYVENGIPLVNPAHITETGIEPDLGKTVSRETAQKLSNYILREGDIVIGRRGEMGRCALVTEVEDGWLCGTGSFFIKPSNRCDMRYLVRLLRSDGCKQRLEKIAGGAVMPNLSNTDLGNLILDLPPVDRQKAIVGEIDELHAETQRLESIYQRKLDALEELKKSLLHQAFNGGL
jgi:type I restriction enzyme S subunit